MRERNINRGQAARLALTTDTGKEAYRRIGGEVQQQLRRQRGMQS